MSAPVLRGLVYREDDLTACAASLRAGSKTFDLAGRLLPRGLLPPVTALYAFCRAADDVIDEATDAPAAWLALQRRLDALFSGAPHNYPEDRALAVAIAQHELPREPLEALLEGFAWDAQQRRYATVDEVEAYGARVAGSVGILMSLIMGERRPAPLARALDLGVAMQLTNICRDVGEDAGLGRIYLPTERLRSVGIDPDAWLASPAASPALGAVIGELLGRADVLYRRAQQGIRVLPKRVRYSIRAAALLYQAIGHRLRRRGYDSVTERTVVPRPQQLLLVARAGLYVPRRPVDLGAPVLPACAALHTSATSEPVREAYSRLEETIDLFIRLEQRKRAAMGQRSSG